MIYSIHDIELADDHDIRLTPNGDVTTATTLLSMRQMVEFRIKTALAEWTADPAAIADLPRLIGEGNNTETGELIEERVMNAITSDLVFVPRQVDVHVVPTSPSELALFVDISDIVADDSDRTSLSLQFQIDFATGHIVGII